MPTKKKHVCTIAEAAAIDFKPLKEAAQLEREIVSPEQWANWLPVISAAVRLLHKSKPQLVEDIKKIDNATGKALFEVMGAGRDYFNSVHKVFDTAKSRLMIAVATVAEKSRKQKQRRAA